MPCPGVAAYGPAHKHTHTLNNETDYDVRWAKKDKGLHTEKCVSAISNSSTMLRLSSISDTCVQPYLCIFVSCEILINIDAFISVHAYFRLYSIWVFMCIQYFLEDTMCMSEKMLNNLWCPEPGPYRWRWTGWLNCQDTNTDTHLCAHKRRDTRTLLCLVQTNIHT